LKNVAFAETTKIKVKQDQVHKASHTDTLMTEKLEKQVDKMMEVWLGKGVTHLSKNKVNQVMTKLGVFHNYDIEEESFISNNTSSSGKLKDLQGRFHKE
jgi:hypothetical protein